MIHLWLYIPQSSVLGQVVCINRCPLEKEASLMRTDNLSNLRYKDKYVEGSLILYPLRKIIRSYELSNCGILATGLQHQARILLCGVVFKFNQKAIGCSHNIHASIVPLGKSCKTSCYCNSQGSQLGKTLDDFLSWKPTQHLLVL